MSEEPVEESTLDYTLKVFGGKKGLLCFVLAIVCILVSNFVYGSPLWLSYLSLLLLSYVILSFVKFFLEETKEETGNEGLTVHREAPAQEVVGTYEEEHTDMQPRQELIEEPVAEPVAVVETPTEGRAQLDFLLQQKKVRLKAALTDLRYDYMRGYIPESEYKTKENELDSQLEDLDKQKERPIDTTPTTPLVVEEDIEPAEMVSTAAPPEVPEEGVHVLRGCAVVGGGFEYKVKVENNTAFVINNITVLVVAYPQDCMELTGSKLKTVSRIEPNGFRSLQFVFTPTKDCVEGQIVASVSYMDHKNQLLTDQTEPYVIRSVCDLMKPLEATVQQFEEILTDMKSANETHTLSWNAPVLFEKTKALLPSRNFYVIEAKGASIGGQFSGTIKGFAKGKYTGKRVAVQLLISGSDDGKEAKVVMEALGDDLAMLPTTIDEVSRGIKSWTCMTCGGIISPAEVTKLKGGEPLKCRYCQHTITIDLYRK
jgi:DNA-directed RNA polymerase subunit RPC12/RpoP